MDPRFPGCLVGKNSAPTRKGRGDYGSLENRPAYTRNRLFLYQRLDVMPDDEDVVAPADGQAEGAAARLHESEGKAGDHRVADVLLRAFERH